MIRASLRLGGTALGAVLTVTGLVAAPASAGQPAPAAQTVTVVASGLDNARGILVGPGGVLLVAEAGRGGAGPCVPAPSQPQLQICLGQSGAVTAVVPPGVLSFGQPRANQSAQWRQYRVVTGLPSLAGDDGSAALGPERLSFSGGRLLATVSLGGNTAMRDALGTGGAHLAHLLELRPGGSGTPFADMLAFEAANNPDGPYGGVVDSNPWGLVSLDDGRTIVTDAASNDLVTVSATGQVSLLAVVPPSQVPAPPFLGLPAGTLITSQSVPTGIVRGPDGAFYFGQLTGFPFPVGGANVFRITAAGALSTYATGFTNVIDVAFDRRGRLLVLSYAKDGLTSTLPGALPVGSLTRINADGTRQELAAGQLLAPGGLAVGPDDAIYVANNSVTAGQGQILRITG
ncbi:ScyD/ScyE family protein [Catellatospora sp. KI3]|uniref:ScyD/ScyE family protein n=1 Tax=Catellatospora sp. KI3 TaxID=3041620 RepID=UPI00248229B6|nr:ScyD/ScyE family protein [Catellatospora sp. KI3]MDI1461056.1 ScyD/ScyE family protein [Catellatospora sp. KI3]